jgi:acyl-CoA thioesterase-1
MITRPRLRARSWTVFQSALGCLLLLVAACSSGSRQEAPSDRPSLPAAPGERAAARPRIVALGDSLTAGLGLSGDDAYPAVLQRMIDKAGYRFEVTNAGVSGDTTAGGLRRLDWALDGDVRILILALGANDGLRGLPVAEMKRNLAEIIERARKRGVGVLLCGMEMPRNLGAAYWEPFHRAFTELARQHRVALVPFLLEKVAGNPALNQGDGIHPNAEGAKLLADTIWPALEPMLKDAANR